MRRLSFISLILLVGAAAAPQQALAQAGTPPPTPPTQTPAQPAAASPAAADDTSRSLFALTDRELFIGGRVTSIDGDPARFQRYQDVRDGLLFSDFRYAFAPPDGKSTFKARANNVGWRDQEYFADYNLVGKLSVTGGYQQIPQFYSVDTMTPYTGTGGTLLLDDAAQRAAQNGAGLSPYVSIAPQFELRERRDIGHVDFVATPTPKLDVTASFTTQKHGGELPWGASFGFSNDVEVPLPYDSRANDFTIGTEWTNTKNMLRVAYSGSWFDNLAPTLVWDSPLRLDDASGAPGRGRMSLWPSNSAQTISFGGYTKLAHKTQVTGFFSYGVVEQQRAAAAVHDQFGAADRLPLPRTNADADAHVFSTNLNLTSHPTTDWRFGARFRNYTYANHMPATSITQYVAYDSSVSTTPTGGPDLYAHDRTTFDADATWDKLKPLALTVGYTHNGNGYDARTFKSSGEDVFRVSADAVGSSWATFRVQYEVGSRTGSGLDEKSADRHRRAPGDAVLRPGRPDEKPVQRAGRHRPVGRLDVQRLRRAPARRLQQHGVRTAEVEREHLLARRRLPPAERPGRGGHLQLRAVYRTAAIARGGFVGRAVQRSRCATGRPTRPRRSTIFPFTRRRPASAATPRCGSRTISATRQAITSTRFRWAARSRRPISCRRCSTSCSSCTSTRATASRRTWRRRSRISTSR